jgi:hypothetical protein
MGLFKDNSDFLLSVLDKQVEKDTYLQAGPIDSLLLCSKDLKTYITESKGQPYIYSNYKNREVMLDYQEFTLEARFSWLQKEFFIAEHQGVCYVFCARDGTKIATIKDITVITSKKEYQREVLAFWDTQSRKIYPPTLEAVFNLG